MVDQNPRGPSPLAMWLPFVGTLFLGIAAVLGAYISSGRGYSDKHKELEGEVRSLEGDVTSLEGRADQAIKRLEAVGLLVSCNSERLELQDGSNLLLAFDRCSESTGVDENAGTWRFRADSPGLYQVSAALAFEDRTPGYVRLEVWKNEVEEIVLGAVETTNNQGWAPTVSGSVILNLEVGDSLAIKFDKGTVAQRTRVITRASWMQIVRLL